MLAFARALEQGADGLELDVQVTAEGVPVVIHDESLDRTTNGHGRVSAVSLERLRTLNAGSGERVPTLSEVLDGFPTTPMIVEIKDGRGALAVRRALMEHRAMGRVVVGALKHSALRPFGRDCFRCASRRDAAWFWAASRLGAPRWHGDYVAFSVPEWYGWLRVVDGAFTRLAGRMAKPVHVWTVDDPAQCRRLRALGVCGIITNFPRRMRQLSN